MIKRILLSTVLATGMVGGLNLAMVDDAFAQRAPRGEDAPQVEGRVFAAENGEKVNAAQEQIKAGQVGAGISTLQSALSGNLNSYERSMIYQIMGSAYYDQNNFNQAISSFESAISSGGLTGPETEQLRVNIAQLLIGNGQYARGAQMLEDYLARGGTPNPKYDEYIMQAYVQSENFSKALPYAEKWFRGANPKERKHYDLLNFLYNNLNMPGRQADIVKEMINRWPEDKQLWDVWASMLANGGREDEAFEVTKMLYLGGALSTEQDLNKVVQYYSFYDMPYQAAQILQKEMSAGRLPRTTDRMVQLSNLLRQAREYKEAIPVLEQAASQANTAKLYADLGEAYYNEDVCDKAEDAFKKAVSRGYSAGKSWFYIGDCRYNVAQKTKPPACPTVEIGQEFPRNFYKGSEWYTRRQSAIEAFRQVPGSSREAGSARKWIGFVGDEEQNLLDKCEFRANVQRERCYIVIDRAYKNAEFTGGFKLEEENQQCNAFKEEFDDKFRRTVDTSGQ